MKVNTRPLCLSPRRKAVLVALYRLARPTPWGLGYSPTFMDVLRHTGVSSTSLIMYHLQSLWRDGLVTHEPGVTRAWRPNYDRVLYVTQDGVTTVSERPQAPEQ